MTSVNGEQHWVFGWISSDKLVDLDWNQDIATHEVTDQTVSGMSFGTQLIGTFSMSVL